MNTIRKFFRYWLTGDVDAPAEIVIIWTGIIVVWVIIILSLCSCAPLPPSTKSPHKTVARITFYDAHEDRFGSRIAIGGRAHEGVTMAAPSVIPFLRRVHIPDLAGCVGNGLFLVQDRGSALERAYRRGQLRLDIYVASRAKRRHLQFALPEYMEAEIQ